MRVRGIDKRSSILDSGSRQRTLQFLIMPGELLRGGLTARSGEGWVKRGSAGVRGSLLGWLKGIFM